jgi:hypothetical protein
MKHIELFKDGYDSTVYDKIRPENWPYIAYDEVNGGIIYSVSKKNDSDLYTVTKFVENDFSYNLSYNYNLVDLGIKIGDSPVLFADRNLGATNPEDPGFYYQWCDYVGCKPDNTVEITIDELIKLLKNTSIEKLLGITIDETWVKNNINDKDATFLAYSPNIIFGKDSYWLIDENNSTDTETKFTSYNEYDNRKLLELFHDAAYNASNHNLRIPFKEEIDLLVDNCDVYYVDEQGVRYSSEISNVKYIEFESKINGNKLIFPNSNFKYIIGTITVGENYCWCNSLYDYETARILGSFFGLGSDIVTARWHYIPIRGVSNNQPDYNIEFPSEILSGNEQQITVKLKCNRPWTIKPFDSYVTFNDGEDTISGVGNQDIIFNISQNNDSLYDNTRTLDFTITYGFAHEDYSEYFWVEQYAYLEDTIDAPDVVEIYDNEGDFNLIAGNYWNLTIDCDWLQADLLEDMPGEYGIWLTAEPTDETRETTITINCGSATKEITVIQYPIESDI